MTRVLLVRHGETEWNRVERFRGRADIPLTRKGRVQAVATGKRIAGDWPASAVYSSPLSRALETAKAIAGEFSLPVFSHDAFIDIDYGEWQGLTPAEANARWPELFLAWHRSPHTVRIPGGESLAQVQGRAVAGVKELETRHADETIVVVSHTVVNRVLLLAVLGLGLERFWNIRQDTCALSVVEMDEGDFILVCMNDICHLRI